MKRWNLICTAALALVAVIAFGPAPVAHASGPEQPCYNCVENGCIILDPLAPGLQIGNFNCFVVGDENGLRCYTGGNICIIGIISAVTLDATRYLAVALPDGDQVFNCDGAVLQFAATEAVALPETISL